MTNIIFNSGFIGLLIWSLLFATSTLALALMIRSAYLLRKRHFLPKVDLAEILKGSLQHGNLDIAYEVCRNPKNKSAICRVFCSVLLAAHRQNRQERQETAVAALDKETRTILHPLHLLSMCANIAPMLGLLGTVTGMVDAFLGLGTAVGPEKASILAISISQALYTTAAGLLIAIPVIACSVFFRNLLERRIESVTELAQKLIDNIPEA